jgi:magnesium transporter
MYCFDENSCERHDDLPIEDLRASIPKGQIAWLNVDGVQDSDIINRIGEQFGLHPLVLEDIANTDERPKIEDYSGYLYFVMSMADQDENGAVQTEQVSIAVGPDFILSFQEDPDDVFDPVRQMLYSPHSRARSMGTDYIAYLLLDAVVDRYFLLLEYLGEKIDELEEEMMDNATRPTLRKIFDLKRELIHLRKAVWPMREIVSNMQRNDRHFLGKEQGLFLRDFHDHIMRVIDTVEAYRDTVSSLVDLYLSHSSIRMNEVMRVLTVISTIFIPLTFITGFYGMNFDYMPEIHSRWAYPVVIGIMGLIVGAQLYYFRKKKWL